jgi:hypothetical protein
MNASKLDVLIKRAGEADLRCSQWLADGNIFFESGKPLAAQRCYAKSQFWLDRRNVLEERVALARIGGES